MGNSNKKFFYSVKFSALMNPERAPNERAEGSPSPQLNNYARIFEQNVNIHEPMTLEMIDSLFTNMNDMYATMGTSFDSLAKGISIYQLN